MGIISISLNDTMMKELDHVQKTLGFTGRSEIVRTGIRNFLQEEKEKLDIKGKKNALLTVVHADEFDDQVAGIKHDYEDLIKTHLHSKIDDKIMRRHIFLLDGESKKIEAITMGYF